MEHRTVFLALFLTTLFSFIAVSFGDDVKHKKVVIKVPKKVKHIHHHHVKKVHIWKHKPKPIHSIHVVEEEEPVGKYWKGYDEKKFPFSHWKHEKPIYEEEEEEEEHDEYKKEGSNHSPVVWKGKKNTRKQRMYGSEKRKKVRGSSESSGSLNGERKKRQKQSPRVPYYDERFYEEPRYQPKQKKPTSSRVQYKKLERRPKPYRAREVEIPDFKDYEYSEYEDYSRERPVWPERKEHISWHIRDDRTKGEESEDPSYISDYQSDHSGEINLLKQSFPDIPVVPPPVLAPAKPQLVLPLKPVFIPQTNTGPQKSYYPEFTHLFKPQNNLKQEKPRYQHPIATDLQQYPKKWNPEKTNYSEGVSTRPKSPKKTNESGISQDTFRTHFDQGVLSGYSSHVGHNPEGGAASFQSVTFGKKILH